MINKSKLWLLVLSGIVISLAVYYICFPGDNDLLVFSDISNSNSSIEIEESEALTAMRIENEESTLKEIETLQSILLDNNKNVEEKNDAYEKIKYLNSNKTNQKKLEENINKEFNVASFVSIKDTNIYVVIDNHDSTYNLANNIISYIHKEFGDTYYVTVKFQ